MTGESRSAARMEGAQIMAMHVTLDALSMLGEQTQKAQEVTESPQHRTTPKYSSKGVKTTEKETVAAHEEALNTRLNQKERVKVKNTRKEAIAPQRSSHIGGGTHSARGTEGQYPRNSVTQGIFKEDVKLNMYQVDLALETLEENPPGSTTIQEAYVYDSMGAEKQTRRKTAPKQMGMTEELQTAIRGWVKDNKEVMGCQESRATLMTPKIEVEVVREVQAKKTGVQKEQARGTCAADAFMREMTRDYTRERVENIMRQQGVGASSPTASASSDSQAAEITQQAGPTRETLSATSRRYQVVLAPDSPVRELVLREAHEALSAGHTGRDKTPERVRRRFWWPRMDLDVVEWVKTCVTCQQTQPRQGYPMGLLQPHRVPSRLWEVVSIDFVTGLPMTQRGVNAFTTFTYKLSKMVHVVPMNYNDSSAEVVVRLFMDAVWRLHGAPMKIV
eukprot:gene34262-biopygen23080